MACARQPISSLITAQLLADSLEQIAEKLIKREPIDVQNDAGQQHHRQMIYRKEEDDTLRLFTAQLLLISQRVRRTYSGARAQQ